MRESIFAEFQYFIKRINAFRSGVSLKSGETIEDLEQRFRVQIERGLVISEPSAQEVAMEILLSEQPESEKRQHIMTLRRTGKTDFAVKKGQVKSLSSKKVLTLEQKRVRALDLIHGSLEKLGIKAQKQPLGVKMILAEFELNNVNYDDPNDLKLLLVNTVKISGHAKKVDPAALAKVFNSMIDRL